VSRCSCTPTPTILTVCCWPHSAWRRISIHDDVVRAFEDAVQRLLRHASPELVRFLAGLRAWIGGSRERHARSGRYHPAPILTTRR